MQSFFIKNIVTGINKDSKLNNNFIKVYKFGLECIINLINISRYMSLLKILSYPSTI